MKTTTTTSHNRRLRNGMLIGILVTASVIFADYWSSVPKSVMATFVGRSTCIDCHRKEAALYEASHHDLAMDIASDETVLGNFDNQTLQHDGITSRLFRDGKRFMVHTEGPTGELQDFEIKYVFGHDPLQQYMVEFDRTENTKANEIARVQVLRISWNTLQRRWFYLRPPDVKEKLLPDDPLHWTGLAQRWQTMCADCHSTNLKSNFDSKALQYHTTFSEIDVSCEACHGPGSVHVELATAKSLFWDRRRGYGLANLKSVSNAAELEACAPCHSRRSLLDANFLPGDAYHEHFQLENLHADTYYADGQIKDEVYEYGSFVQSRMCYKNIRCSDCHDPHSLKLKQPGNQVCTSCHQHPAGKYDVPAHHHHALQSAGASCIDCHMPGRTYMDIDYRHDHSLRVPRPDLSVESGTPNACSSCHVKDQLKSLPEHETSSLKEYADCLDAADAGQSQIAAALKATDRWCAEACDRWYGTERQKQMHFGTDVAAFRRRSPSSVGPASPTALTSQDDLSVDKLLQLAASKDASVSFIARASALDDLATAAPGEGSAIAKAILEDVRDHPRVRAAALPCLSAARPSDLRRWLMPMLNDSAKQVRHQAAQMLATTEIYPSLSSSERTKVDLSLRDVHTALMAVGDRAGAHLAWALLCEQRQMFPEAIEAYQTAIRVEPTSAGARTNLAALLEQTARPEDALSTEQARELRRQELPLLRRDAGLAPKNASVQYRYGLALYLSGNHAEALRQLVLAAALAPNVSDYETAVRLLRERMAHDSASAP